jgi:ribosome-associated protein
MIRLGQLLKLAAVIDSGAEVKAFLSTEPVWVNGDPEARRGRQLRLGDIVTVGERRLRVTSGLPLDNEGSECQLRLRGSAQHV